MSQLFDSLKALMTSERISRAAKVVEEKDANVSTASSSIIASFLAVLAKNGHTQQIKNILEEAGKLDILSNIGNICDDKATKDQLRIGDDFTQHLLGDKAAEFTGPIANKAGISKVATNRLISMMAPVIAGFLGNKMVKENVSYNKLLNEIDSQKGSFASYIPNELINSFGLTSFFNKHTDKVVDNKHNHHHTAQPEKKKRGWITWLILLLLLLLLLFLWRSCRHNRNNDMYYEPTEVVTDTLTTVVEPVNSVYDRNMTELTLPNGVRLNAYEGGIEEEMLDLLNNNNFANMSDADLKDHWFEFDNINFKFDSGTELMGDSQNQLDNVIAILKYYKNAKVKVAAFADRVGSEEANIEISQERARTIETMLENAGLGSQIVKAEGYGEEYAQYSAGAPDSQRRHDRDIALRFTR